MTKSDTLNSLNDELGEHIAERANGKSRGLKNGFSTVGLEHYIMADYQSGELIKFDTFLFEGYSKQSLFKLKNRLTKGNYITRCRHGVYEVC